MKYRRMLLLLIIPVAWYGFVLLLPKLAGQHGEPAQLTLVRNEIRLLASKKLSTEEITREIGQFNARKAKEKNPYDALLTLHKNGMWEVVFAPEHHETYSASLVTRILFLDFSKVRWPMYRIRSGSERVDKAP